ncbi:MAG: GNAT family N-acetyltransferase [Elainellaceae cyanobacterium]
MSGLRLRSTKDADLDYVLEAETSEENRPYIMFWSRQEHRQALSDPNIAHLIVEPRSVRPAPVGYLIMVGLCDPNHSIHLRRIVITDKGKGFGKGAIAQVKQIAFETHRAHRLWLDVKPFNERARAIYRAAGFVEEGTLRECFKAEEGYGSLVIMSMLRQEYEAAL